MRRTRRASTAPMLPVSRRPTGICRTETVDMSLHWTAYICTGAAPDAQVLVMKVFGDEGGAYDSDYTAAIEDAIVLGADTINLSLGSCQSRPEQGENGSLSEDFRRSGERFLRCDGFLPATPAIGPRTPIRSAIFTATASACRRMASPAAMQTA